MSAEQTGFVLRMNLSARSGMAADQRELRESSCESLVDAAAIVVSLRAQEPQHAAEKDSERPRAAPEPEPAPQAARATFRGVLALGAGAGTGLLPGFALAPELGAGIETDALRVVFGALLA